MTPLDAALAWIHKGFSSVPVPVKPVEVDEDADGPIVPDDGGDDFDDLLDAWIDHNVELFP